MLARTHALTAMDLDARQAERDDADLMAWRDRVDSDLQHLDDTPVPPPIVRCAPKRPRNWIARAWRRIVLAVLREELDCIVAEREAYQVAATARGYLLGAQYLANCADQERDLRSRIAMLECGLP